MNPFAQDASLYFVLQNAQGQFSLWPSFVQVPEGWTVLLEDEYEICVHYINAEWHDLTPKGERS
ncbi:MbtH family NRPS accessory protein [Salicibibacter cibi]|uniref:MbtH family NRPS accessory protein n=1 Tax=Salicibibacter cibi TaxID=2743001 RepID=A0A7T7CGT1_9BACI|nr:MbtH family NRPS accessory protein [Salicibibacter cibi]QQK81515.1 MbtH family NRPS accessory protein [Salicibibacter cibi]